MSDVVSTPAPAAAKLAPGRRSADWGGKALLVCALALLMAIPGLFVFALVAERSHRADTVVEEVSGLQGGSQQVRETLLPGDAADEDDRRAIGVDAVLGQDIGAAVRGVLLGVDAVVNDMHPVRVHGGIAAQHVGPHPG